jgi:N-acetylmuramoyl-L-alanine amidase
VTAAQRQPEDAAPASALPMRERPSPNHDARPGDQPIDMLVLHYTGMPTAQAALDRLTNPAPPAPLPPVSCHYLVEEDGLIWRLVPEGRRAWHAGVSAWRGHSALNSRSIGIEIVNPGHEWGYRDFPALQMAAVAELCLDILSRHPIPARNVVAHSDVAPDRKQDPGELFDWQGLAENGIGLWPGPSPATALPPEAEAEAEAASLLAEIGYAVDPGRLRSVVTAFQRHWHPESVDGRVDAATLARLRAVAALVAAQV